MRIYLDIETIPTQREDIETFVLGTISAPANYKDPQKIQTYIDAQAEEAVRKTALEGWAGEVWCIGWAVDGAPATIQARKGLEWQHEAELLSEWVALLPSKNPIWVGHNILWDLRFLWQRCKVLGVDTWGVDFALDAKPWDAGVVDTMTRWAGARERISLKKLALAFGLQAKDGMDGSMVWDAIKSGLGQEVMDYCKSDVELTREIARRLL